MTQRVNSAYSREPLQIEPKETNPGKGTRVPPPVLQPPNRAGVALILRERGLARGTWIPSLAQLKSTELNQARKLAKPLFFPRQIRLQHGPDPPFPTAPCGPPGLTLQLKGATADSCNERLKIAIVTGEKKSEKKNK